MEKSLCLASSASVASTTTGSDGALQGDVLFVGKEQTIEGKPINPARKGRSGNGLISLQSAECEFSWYEIQVLLTMDNIFPRGIGGNTMESGFLGYR